MVFNSKKGQFLILSAYVLILLLLFINSLETENTYIDSFSKNIILTSIQRETCSVAKMGPGTELDSRFSTVHSQVASYCETKASLCNITITKKVGAPANTSLLDYTHYTYKLEYNYSNYYYNSTFIC
jgi:hypothetical protein